MTHCFYGPFLVVCVIYNLKGKRLSQLKERIIGKNKLNIRVQNESSILTDPPGRVIN